MKRPTYLILAIIFLVLIVIFTLQNTNEMDVKVFIWDIYVSQAILIFSVFSAGVLLAISLMLPTIIRLKREVKSAKKMHPNNIKMTDPEKTQHKSIENN